MAKNAQKFEQRPWGTFEILSEFNIEEVAKHLPAGDIVVKKISVNPGQRLSYQSHAKRMELWCVVQGQGTVILDDLEIQVQKGSVVTVDLGKKHRIINDASIPLIFVEIAEGEFDENDIVRHQDDYGRN